MFYAMKRHFLILWAILLMPLFARSYDYDTHFYEMYLMARYSGIGHDVALYIATFNQFVDFSAMTSPRQVYPVVDGIRKRRMFHFPSNLVYRTRYPDDLRNHGIPINFLDQTQPNSPIAHEMIWSGLKAGNLMLTSAGLHVLMDSFAHSPYSPAIGHASFGFAPDRSYQYPEKHRAMTKAIFRSLVVVRAALPENAIDRGFRDGAGLAHHILDADELFRKYDANAEIQDVMLRDILRDPRYVKEVLGYITRAGRRRLIFTEDFDIEEFLNRTGYQVDGEPPDRLVRLAMENAFALPKAERDQLIRSSRIFELYMRDFYINDGSYGRLSIEERQQFIGEFSRRLVAHIIPTALSKDVPTLYEFRRPPRRLELRLRTGDRQRLILKMTGVAIAHSKGSLSGVIRGLLRINRSLASTSPLAGLDELDQKIELANQIWTKNASVGTIEWSDRLKWNWHIFHYFYLEYWGALIGWQVSAALNSIQPWHHFDLAWGQARLEGSKGTFLYYRERAFQKMISFGIIKNLISSTDVDRLILRHRSREERLQNVKINVESLYALLRDLEARPGSSNAMTEFVDTLSSTRDPSARFCSSLF